MKKIKKLLTDLSVTFSVSKIRRLGAFWLRLRELSTTLIILSVKCATCTINLGKSLIENRKRLR
ncbi:hypothetical protein [Lactococcus lactis]|uniref:hypothetical protein n=1 Tax=Lactococcus lactis TaxID=1358 RepID=UPI00128EEB7A|nr:hypothetical protein [Lactococcus lactis]